MHRVRLAIALIILFSLVLLGSPLFGQTQPEQATLASLRSAAKITVVTPKPGFHNEPSIAVDSANPTHAFAAFQTPASVVFSRDGGLSWQAATDTAPNNYKVSGDVGAAYGKHGIAFLSYIAFDKLGTENYWAQGATRNGLFVRRSLDGGATWEKQDHSVLDHPTKPGIPFEDKPGLTVDTTNSKYAGNVYIGWTEFRIDESVILFSRSGDDGATWSPPIDISTHHGLPRDDNGAVEGFSAAVGSDGTVYAVWADDDTIAFTSSHDGGRTFGKSRSVIKTAPLFFAIAGLERANGFPVLGIDRRDGKGRLYVVWSDYRDGDIGIYCSSSRDAGKTWTNAVRVNSNPPHDGTDQFFPWLAVDPATGAVNIIFYDRRLDRSNRKTTVTLARSTDGGLHFTNYALNNDPFVSTNEEFLGDYIGIAALNNKVFGAWAAITPEQGSKSEQHEGCPQCVVKVGVVDFPKSAP